MMYIVYYIIFNEIKKELENINLMNEESATFLIKVADLISSGFSEKMILKEINKLIYKTINETRGTSDDPWDFLGDWVLGLGGDPEFYAPHLERVFAVNWDSSAEGPELRNYSPIFMRLDYERDYTIISIAGMFMKIYQRFYNILERLHSKLSCWDSLDNGSNYTPLGGHFHFSYYSPASGNKMELEKYEKQIEEIRRMVLTTLNTIGFLKRNQWWREERNKSRYYYHSLHKREKSPDIIQDPTLSYYRWEWRVEFRNPPSDIWEDYSEIKDIIFPVYYNTLGIIKVQDPYIIYIE
ncbi:MAG: hypothetical protein ACP5H7_02630 [Minisyncoccia bacterium]